MAIEYKQADVAQRTAGERLISSAKKALKSSPEWYSGVDPISPQHEPPPKAKQEKFADYSRPVETPLIQAIIQKHKERLAYNAAYQRDLRTIKRLGLEITVANWRKINE